MNPTTPRIRLPLILALALAFPLGCESEPSYEEALALDLEAELEQIVPQEASALALDSREPEPLSEPLPELRVLSPATLNELGIEVDLGELEVCLLIDEQLWCWVEGEDEPIEAGLVELDPLEPVPTPHPSPFDVNESAIPDTSDETKPQEVIVDELHATTVTREEEPPREGEEPGPLDPGSPSLSAD